jgi:hypothetical protein
MWNFIKLGILFFLGLTGFACSSAKSTNQTMVEYSYIIELVDSLNAKYIERQMELPQNAKINRINRTKNTFNFTLISSEESSFKILERLKADSNVISISIEDVALHKSQGKPVSVKK